MIYISFIACITLSSFICQVTTQISTRRQNDLNIISSYSTVTKQIPETRKTIVPLESRVFNPLPQRSIDVASFLTNGKDGRLAKTKAQAASRRFDQLDWLDPGNVSSERDDLNSTAKAMEYLMELNASANQRTKKTTKNTSFLCSESFGDEEFFIRSSNYPFNYPAFTTCEYTIKRKNETVCGIIFTILRFDLGSLGDSKSCTGDKVLIGNQVICGRLRKGTESFYRFTWPTLKITFSSGSGFGASGFLIKGRQTEHCLPEKPFPKPLASSVPCNRKISDTTFNLTSPSFPLDYPHELECQYEVIQANWNICGLLLTPSTFLLEGASYCMFDYIEIQGKRLCGNRTSPEELYYMFEDDKINIRFRTDETVSNNGFYFVGKQVPCTDLEYFQPIHSPLNSVDSVRESKAKNDLHDIKDISHALSLLVKSGFRQNEKLSARESKTIFGTDSDDHHLSTSQINLDDIFNSDEDSTTVGLNTASDFSTDTDETVTVKPLRSSDQISGLFSSCDEQHSSESFIVKSVNYPDLYPNNIQCTYYIQRSNPDVCQLRLTLEDVAIDKSSNTSDPQCLSDYLDVAGYKVCGNHKKSIMYVTFTGENVIMRFKSDSKGSDRGYLVTVEQIDKDCGRRSSGRERKLEDVACDSIIRYDNFTIFSPGYPQWYPPNLLCTTTIYKASPDIKSLEVSLEEFAVESSPQCENDYLSIGKLRFCGHRNGNSYMIPFLAESIPLTFVTNGEESSTGFRIKVNQMSDLESKTVTPQCGGIYYSSTVTLTSPQFPSDQTKDQHCIYTIVRNSPDVCQLQFKIIHFDLDATPGCRTDYLQIGLRRLCGKNFDNEIHNYHFKNEKFTLVFHSDSKSSGKGFKIEARQRSCQKSNNNGLIESNEEQTTPKLELDTTEKNPFHGPNFVIQEPNKVPFNSHPNFFISNDKNFPSNINTVSSIPSKDKFKNTTDCNCRFYGIEGTNNQHAFYKPQTSAIPVKPKGCNRCKLYPISNPYTVKYSYYQIDSAESINIPPVIKSDDPNIFKFRPITGSPGKTDGLREKKVQKSSNSGIWIYNDWQSPTNPSNFISNGEKLPVFHHDPFSANRHQAARALTALNQTQSEHISSNNFVLEDENPSQKFSHSSISKISEEETDEPLLNVLQESSYLPSASSLILTRLTPNSPIPGSNSLPFIHSTSEDLLKESPLPSSVSTEVIFPLQLENESPNFDKSLKLCNKSIATKDFEMKSPGYPGPFYVDMHCFYLIYRHDDSRCGLLLNIDMLDLPGTPPCLKTYLSISGRRFCGTKRSGIKVVVPFSPISPIAIEFRSDMFHSGAGFSLKAEQIPCNFSLVPGQKVFSEEISNQNVAPDSSESSNIDDNIIAPSESQNIFTEYRSNENLFSEHKKFPNKSSGSAIKSFARGYVTVPWTGVRGARYPPYKRGLELVKLRKAELRG